MYRDGCRDCPEESLLSARRRIDELLDIKAEIVRTASAVFTQAELDRKLR